MTGYYTGIGSRTTPQPILEAMTSLAQTLECAWILRSGGANGADKAFEDGVNNPDNTEIYLPWSGFNNNTSERCHITNDAYVMAEHYHPNWKACSDAARKFHARNCYQMLGYDLATPSHFVICWTPGAKVTGGTGQAMRIAIDRDIHIYNLADVYDEILINNLIALPEDNHAT